CPCQLPASLCPDPPAIRKGRAGPRICPRGWDDDRVKYAENIADLVGNTPFVTVNEFTKDVDGRHLTACSVLAKVEYLMPGGSGKARVAARRIDAADGSS